MLLVVIMWIKYLKVIALLKNVIDWSRKTILIDDNLIFNYCTVTWKQFIGHIFKHIEMFLNAFDDFIN